jgi:hypothetical protein
MINNMINKKKRLQDALDYLNYAEKEGVSVPDIDNLTDTQIIELAEGMQDEADAKVDKWKEDYGEI